MFLRILEIFDFVYSKVIIMQTFRVTKWSGITMFLRTFEISDFGHVPMVINTAALSERCFALLLSPKMIGDISAKPKPCKAPLD